MKKAAFVIRLWIDTIWKNLFVLVIMTVLVFLIEFISSQEGCINDKIQLMQSLEKEVFFSFQNGRYKLKDIPTVLQDVKRLHTITERQVRIGKNDMPIYIYDSYCRERIKLPLAKGGWFDDSGKQVVVTQSMGEQYKIGDKITIEYYENNNQDEIDIGLAKTIEKEVVGILANDTIFCPDTISTSISTGDIVKNLSSSTGNFYGTKGFGIISNDTDLCIEKDCGVVGLLEGKEKQGKELLEDCQEQGRQLGVLSMGSDIVKETREEQDTYKKQLDMFAVCIGIISIVSIGGMSYLEICRQKKNHAIYYLYGFTRKEVWLMNNIKYLVMLFFALFVGTWLLLYQMEKRNLAEIAFKNRYIAVAALVIIILYEVATIPVYLLHRKTTIVDLLREESE